MRPNTTPRAPEEKTQAKTSITMIILIILIKHRATCMGQTRLRIEINHCWADQRMMICAAKTRNKTSPKLAANYSSQVLGTTILICVFVSNVTAEDTCANSRMFTQICPRPAFISNIMTERLQSQMLLIGLLNMTS